MDRRRRAWLAVLAAGGLVACAPSRPEPSLGEPTAYEPFVPAPVDERGFEEVNALEPPWLLPPSLASGPHHEVVAITHDGFTNHYHVATDFGPVEVSTTGLLRKRVHEITVMAALEAAELSANKVYLLSTANAAREPVEGAAQLLFHPVRSAIDIPSGIWIYGRRLAALTDFERTFHEDDYGAELIGFSGAKRLWAYRLGVDVYTDNPMLQQLLDRYAWISLGGGLSVRVPLMVVSGPAGYALTVSNTTSQLKRELRDQAPEDIRMDVRRRLAELGVDAPVAQKFVSHPWYTPTGLLVISESLALMEDAENPQSLIEAAIRADEPHEPYLFGRLAIMLAVYSEVEAPIAELTAPDGIVMARTDGGDWVVPLYLDLASWTEPMSLFLESIDRRVPADAGRKRVVVSGVLSARTRQQFEARGWEVVEGVDMTWLADVDRNAWQPGEPDPGRVLPEFGR